MIEIIFISLAVGILIYKFADELKWEERLLRRKKERRVAWLKKQKGVQYGKGVRKGIKSKPGKRKRKPKKSSL